MSVLEKFREKFFEKFDGAALVISKENRFYLTGFESSDGAVIVTKDKAYLLVDFRYFEIAQKISVEFEVLLAKGSLLSMAAEIFEKERINNVIIEDDYITILMYERLKKVLKNIQISNMGDFLSVMRAEKTETEIQKIINAQKLTDAAFEHILSVISKNMTENDVALELDYFMRKNGAQESAFKTIAVSGTKSSLPHGEPEDIKLTENSFLTMDFGARLDGYCADMTRTIVIGKADEEMKHIYNVVLNAQLSALSKIKAGICGDVVDEAARGIITAEGFGDCFGHSTGHGLGIEVHEFPAYSPNFKKPIPENAVLSIEPGIYIEGKYGVRIEDIAVVKKENALNLTRSDKKLIEI